MTQGNKRTIRRAARDLAAETFAHLPLFLKGALLRELRRPILWLFFHLEREEICISRVGPSGHRFKMRLPWQGGLDCVLGVYESQAIEALTEAVMPGSCCVDVGANSGYYSILMAHLVGPSGHVIAFEPVPQNSETLAQNVALNHLSNICIESHALGDISGSMSLYLSTDEGCTSTPSVKAYAVQGKAQQIEVPVRTLDEYLSGAGVEPDLIKIDVEGAEMLVLRGAAQCLREIRPNVLIEVHDWPSVESREVFDLLVDYGYQPRLLTVRGREGIFFCSSQPKLLSDSSGVQPLPSTNESARAWSVPNRATHRQSTALGRAARPKG